MSPNERFMNAEAKISALLDEQCARLKAGDVSAAAELASAVDEAVAEIDAAAATVKPSEAIDKAARRLREGAAKAARLLNAARDGVAAARRLIETARSASVATGAYGRTGEPIAPSHAPLAQRRV